MATSTIFSVAAVNIPSLNTLTMGLQKHILSFLPKEDKETVMALNRSWRKAVIISTLEQFIGTSILEQFIDISVQAVKEIMHSPLLCKRAKL